MTDISVTASYQASGMRRKRKNAITINIILHPENAKRLEDANERHPNERRRRRQNLLGHNKNPYQLNIFLTYTRHSWNEE